MPLGQAQMALHVHKQPSNLNSKGSFSLDPVGQSRSKLPNSGLDRSRYVPAESVDCVLSTFCILVGGPEEAEGAKSSTKCPLCSATVSHGPTPCAQTCMMKGSSGKVGNSLTLKHKGHPSQESDPVMCLDPYWQ